MQIQREYVYSWLHGYFGMEFPKFGVFHSTGTGLSSLLHWVWAIIMEYYFARLFLLFSHSQYVMCKVIVGCSNVE